MKKEYKICLNLTETEFIQLKILAEKDRRPLASFCELKLLDATEKERAEALRIGEGSFNKVNTADILTK